jgi:hypothetical protein
MNCCCYRRFIWCWRQLTPTGTVQTLRHRMNRCYTVGSSDGAFSLCLPLSSHPTKLDLGASVHLTLPFAVQLIQFNRLWVFLRFSCFQCVSMSTLSCLASRELECAYNSWHLMHGQATSVWTPLNSTVKHYKLANSSVLHFLVTLGNNNVLGLVAFVHWYHP